jgi:TPR repeat protein
MRRLIFTMVVSLLGVLPLRAGEFETGIDAYAAGDYANAFASWLPLAQRGHAKAQASIGFLYYAGKGVRRDDKQALLWFGKAAEAGQPTAQFFLGLHYYYGRGVRRDLARAHSWCDIAVSNGYSESLFCRDAVALEMSPEDMRRSNELTAAFYRSHAFRN